MNTPMSDTQEKLEEFWGKCFHPATKVVYTTDHYKVGKEEFISIVSGFINQARKEAAIEELESIPVAASFDRIYIHILGRLQALKEGK